MKTITVSDIRGMNPCYDPSRYLKEDFEGTLIDLLKNEKIPAVDRLWVCVRQTLLTDKELQLYGLVCARMCEKYAISKEVKECNDVVERFLEGKATREELFAAGSAAGSAARSAGFAAWSAESAARSAGSAARSAARFAESAARSAESAARSAGSAARSAESAARSAESAARSAGFAAWSAGSAARFAESAMEEAQCEALIKILERKSE
jgi:hypothetical protein